VSYITEPPRQLPIYADADVVVAGGGPAGFAAAVAEARLGAKTVLVERQGFLGGMITGGLVVTIGGYNCWIEPFERVVTGVGGEMIDRAEELGGAENNEGFVLNSEPEVLKVVCDDMVLDSGVQMLLHSRATAPYMEGGRVRGLIIENKSGRSAVLAKVVVDATGDADIAALAGAPFEKVEALQPMTMGFIMGNVQGSTAEELAGGMTPGYTEPGVPKVRLHRARRIDVVPDGDAMAQAREAGEIPVYGGPWFGGLYPDRVWVNGVRIVADSTDADSLTMAEVQGRRDAWSLFRYLRGNVEALRDSTFVMTGAHIGLRESRRIIGDYRLTGDDVRSEARFPDGVGLGCWWTDVHPSDGRSGLHLDFIPWPYQIPYRTMLPQGVEGLLVAGRSVSADRAANGSLRVAATCMMLGEAAGTAAALASAQDITPRRVDAAQLQGALGEQGAKLEPEYHSGRKPA